MTNLILGDLLRRHRLEASLTQKELADLVGYDHTSISRFERNPEHTPKPDFIERFIAALHLPAEEAQQIWNAYRRETGEAGPPQQTRRQDWGEAPDVSTFYGRYDDLVTLTHWLADEQCRLIALLGMGGIGKTALATKLARQTAEQFEYVLWRSLRNAPPLRELLTEAIQFLSDQQEIDLPERTDKAITRLLHYLAAQRCLLILDNAEAILQEGQAGHYRSDYEDYGHLLQRIGESEHQSCIIVTSREKPREVGQLEGEAGPVRSHSLTGLQLEEGRQILAGKRLTGSTEAWEALVQHYSGNPLALNIVAEMIREVYDSDIDDFLTDEAIIFGRIGDVLGEQFGRLSALEQSLMYWLAIEREPVSREVLLDNLVEPVSKRDLAVALRSLRRRSLIEQSGAEFTLQNVVMEYMTDRLVEGICQEILSGEIGLFNSHALMKATAKEYVRESQIRLILSPLADQLLMILGKVGIEEKLASILSELRQETQPHRKGYAVGNIINMLCHFGLDLTGFDFSQLAVWQAYVQKVNLRDVNFSHSDLVNTVFTKYFADITMVTFSPNSQLLAYSSLGRPRVWKRRDSQHFPFRGHHTLSVFSGTFSPDNLTFASGSEDQMIKLWDVTTGECLQTLEGHTAVVKSVAFSFDGRILASGSEDQMIKLWDVTTGKCIDTLEGFTDNILLVTFNPNEYVLTSDITHRMIKLWDMNTGNCLKTFNGHSDYISSIAISPDGLLLASGSYDQTVKLWDINTGECLKTLDGHIGTVQSIIFSPDGCSLMSGCHDQTVRLWDITTGNCLRILTGHIDSIRSVAFSPDGLLLASGSYDQTVKLWDANTGECLYTLQGHINWVRSVAISPDGLLLASGNSDQTVKLWDISTGKCLKTLIGHVGNVRSVVFSPDGSYLASGSYDQTAKLWEVSTGKCLKTLYETTDWNRVLTVSFSPDGQLLAKGGIGQTITLWETSTGACIETLQCNSYTDEIVFSPNGQLLASANSKVIKLWEVTTGNCIKTLEGHSSVLSKKLWYNNLYQQKEKGVERMKKQYKVELKEEERNELKRMTEKGVEKVRKINRAQILLLADKDKKDKEIAEWIGVTTGTVQRIRKRYATEGLKSAIGEKARSGRPIGIKAETRAKITALACTDAPEGRARWTLRLLADKVVELEYIERISHQSVDNILKKTN